MQIHCICFIIIMQRVKQCRFSSNAKPATWKGTINIIPRCLGIHRDYDYAELLENFIYNIILKKRNGRKKKTQTNKPQPNLK